MTEINETSEGMKAEIEVLYTKMADLGLVKLANRASEAFLANLTLAKSLDGAGGVTQVDLLNIFRGYREALSGIIASYERNDCKTAG